MTSIISQAMLADDDLERVQRAGLLSSQRVLARIRSGFARMFSSRGGLIYSARDEMLNHLVPVMARTMAVAHLMGERRSKLMGALAMDRFSEVMAQVRAAGLGESLTRLQRGYARRLYDSMRQMGADVDAKTRAAIASLIAEGEPPGRGMKILMATLDKLGVGDVGQSKLETIYRTEASIAYHAGRWQADQKDPDVWGYQYVTMRDDRVRPAHAALDRTTLPKGALFWRRYWPPNGWNCRCQVVTLHKKHKERLPGKIDGKVPPPDDGFGQNFGKMLGEVIEFRRALWSGISFTKVGIALAFDPNQARDYHGRWTDDKFSRLNTVNTVDDLRKITGVGSVYDVDGFYDKVVVALHNRNTTDLLDAYAKKNPKKFAKLRIASLRNLWLDSGSQEKFGNFLKNGIVQLYRGVEIDGRLQGRSWTTSKRIAEAFAKHGSRIGFRGEGRNNGTVRTESIPVRNLMFYSDAQGESEVISNVAMSLRYRNDDIAFDYTTQKRVEKGHEGGGRWTKEDSWPTDLEDLEHVKHLGGSTGADLYEHAGKKYVMKKGASEEHVKNEHLANMIYRQLGVPVPESRLYDYGGKKVMLVEFVEGKTLNQLTLAEQKAAELKLQDHFAADALLANWDVVALNKDNIVVDAKGTSWRIDNGGALAFRAKGASKGSKWNADLDELVSMRKNGVAGQVFGGLTNEQVETQVADLVANHSLVFKDDVLAKRFTNLEQMKAGYKKWPWDKDKEINLDDIVAKPKSHYMGSTVGEKMQTIKSKAKAKYTDLQLKKLALFNEKEHELVVLKVLHDDQKQALIDAFPGKQVKTVTGTAKKLAGKLGVASSKEAWYMTPSKMHELAYKVTAEEKKIAIGMAKTATEKAAAEALKVKEVEAAVFLPSSDASPHWKRVKVENGSTVPYVMSKGNWDEIAEKAKKLENAVLTPKEAAAVSAWKGSASTIRDAMVKGSLDGTPNPHKKGSYEYNRWEHSIHLELACKKAPSFEGVVYRGVGHVVPGTKYYDAMQKVGNVIEFEAHACSSRETGMRFGGGVCMMRIAQKSGAAMEDTDGCHDEREVILKRGTKYRVVGTAHNVKMTSSTGHKITWALFVDLEEVSDSAHEKLALSRLPRLLRRWS